MIVDCIEDTIKPISAIFHEKNDVKKVDVLMMSDVTTSRMRIMTSNEQITVVDVALLISKLFILFHRRNL